MPLWRRSIRRQRFQRGALPVAAADAVAVAGGAGRLLRQRMRLEHRLQIPNKQMLLRWQPLRRRPIRPQRGRLVLGAAEAGAVRVAKAALPVAGGTGQRMRLEHRRQILSRQMPPRQSIRRQLLILQLQRRAAAVAVAVVVAVVRALPARGAAGVAAT